MIKGRIKDEKGEVLIDNIIWAKDTISRMKGLMFVKDMPNCNGFLIEPCNSIHTFFMKFSLDVAFLNKNNEVVKIFKNLKPWRITRIYFSAKKVLEMKAGTMPSSLVVGKRIVLECTS